MKQATLFSRQEIADIVDVVRLSPSVHNIQPWLVTLSDTTVSIQIDERHVLKEGDPTGRETVISLGIFCEAFRLVALEKGLSTTRLTYKNRQATLKLTRLRRKPLTKTSTTELLRRRSTDRSIYRPVVISKADVTALKTVSKGLRATVHVIVDKSVLQTIAELTGHGIALALSNPSFRKELSHYLLLPQSQKKRGIAVKSLYIPSLLADMEPLLMSLGIGTGAEVRLEKKRWLSASAVVIISGEGDLERYWLDVGRAYLRASLAIENLGLSQATSAALVEASNYHEDVEAILGTRQRILSVIRIGKGRKSRHYSPRIGVKDILGD